MPEHVGTPQQAPPLDSPPVDLSAMWKIGIAAMLCPHCDWRYLVAEGLAASVRCPHCCQATLAPMDDAVAHLPYQHPPELTVPFSVDAGTLDKGIEAFTKDIPFAPADLSAETLRSRLQQVYVPLWMVDSEISATWRAEVGFDYDVVSHQERYADGRGWSTQEVQETRNRWEPRLGRLARTYNNIVAPAHADHAELRQQLGRYDLKASGAYDASAMARSMVRLPDRAPEAAWSSAVPGFHQAAAEECRHAARADHIRQFRWSPRYESQNWTLLLLPVYATYYLDDEEQPQPVLINGQTGHLHGTRRASMKRAQRMALIIAIVAAVLFALGLCVGAVGLAAPPVTVLGLIGAGLSLLILAGALIPIVIAARFNRQQAKRARAKSAPAPSP